MKKNISIFALIAFGLTACGTDEGQGSLNVTIWGEDYIEQEIPAAEFEDGYRIEYSKFYMSLSELKIATQSGDIAVEEGALGIYDITKKGPRIIGEYQVDAKHWDAVSLAVSPAQNATSTDLDATDLAMMNDNGYALYVEGKIYNDQNEAWDFSWGFKDKTSYLNCVDHENKAGVNIAEDGEESIQFTMHGDHFFYDSYKESAVLRAKAIIEADANLDHQISLEELDAVNLTTLPLDQYDTDGDGSIETLGDFVRGLSKTVVHFQGEGHCQSQ